MLYLSAVSSPGSTSCITSWLAVSAGTSTDTACNLYVFGICYLFWDLHHWKWRKWQGCLKSLPLKSAIHRKIIAHQENCLVSGDNNSTPTEHCLITSHPHSYTLPVQCDMIFNCGPGFGHVSLFCFMLFQNFFRNARSLFTFYVE